ncbi:MAG TPA: M48 family metalloprotease [Gammaproteobacteria bacterium]|nr:M48 family metalloprotease [Gammaproteobacteria bacterium]
MKRRAALLLAGLLALGLPTVAGSIDVSNLFSSIKQAFTPATLEEEEAIGNAAAATLLGATKPIKDKAVQDYVNKVGLWVALQSDRPDLPWRFAVVDSDDIDAFAAPGGYVFITRGLLQHMHSEAELAGVLGHEITHVVLKHHLNALRRAAKLDIAGQAAQVGLASKGYNSTLDQQAFEKVSNATRNLYSTGLDKGDELDADRAGVVLAARAGYDPYGLLAVLQTLEGVDPKSGRVQLLLATHPSPEDRIAALSAAMAAGHMDKYGSQEEGTQRFVDAIKSLPPMKADAPATQAAPVAASKH